MTTNLIQILSGVPLFSGLPETVLGRLSENAFSKSYRTQDILVHQGDIWPYLFLVERGEIKALKDSPLGRTLIANTLKSGSVFWGISFFQEDKEMPATLQAVTDTRIWLWQRAYFRKEIMENGEIGWGLCQEMINHMIAASEVVGGLAFQPVVGRLAKLLLDEFGEAENKFTERSLTLAEMAAHIGTTQEMVCRHLYRFAEKGAIEIRRTEMKIVDRTFLKSQFQSK
ncbi:MAG: Crp/Fnr family transcriptional regulator [Anaerolineales bacterium]